MQERREQAKSQCACTCVHVFPYKCDADVGVPASPWAQHGEQAQHEGRHDRASAACNRDSKSGGTHLR